MSAEPRCAGRADDRDPRRGRLPIVPENRGWTGEPDLLESAERILGTAARDALWRAFSARKVYVPKWVTADHPIALAVGVGGMQLLAAELGGITVEVPTSPECGPRGRRDRICALMLAGIPRHIIAREAICTERRVNQIIADLRADGKLPPGRRDLTRKDQ